MSFGFGVFSSTFMLPLVGLIRPAISDKIVVFPHPEGPTIEINSCSAMFKFMFSSASVSESML